MSTQGAQEKPYAVTGSVLLAGVEKRPKAKYVQIGALERGKPETGSHIRLQTVMKEKDNL